MRRSRQVVVWLVVLGASPFAGKWVGRHFFNVKPPPDSHEVRAALSTASRLQLRWVVDRYDLSAGDVMDDPIPSKDPASPATPITVNREIVVNESMIERAFLTRTPNGQRAIGVKFTPVGAERMRLETTRHIGHRLAILWDGKLISAPRVNTTIETNAIIEGGKDGFTPEQLNSMIAALDHATTKTP